MFGRYDWVNPKKDANAKLQDNYFNVGIAFTPYKMVDFALVYKHDKEDTTTLPFSPQVTVRRSRPLGPSALVTARIAGPPEARDPSPFYRPSTGRLAGWRRCLHPVPFVPAGWRSRLCAGLQPRVAAANFGRNPAIFPEFLRQARHIFTLRK